MPSEENFMSSLGIRGPIQYPLVPHHHMVFLPSYVDRSSWEFFGEKQTTGRFLSPGHFMPKVSPVSIFHRQIALSEDPVAIVVLSAEIETEVTEAMQLKVLMTPPV